MHLWPACRWYASHVVVGAGHMRMQWQARRPWPLHFTQTTGYTGAARGSWQHQTQVLHPLLTNRVPLPRSSTGQQVLGLAAVPLRWLLVDPGHLAAMQPQGLCTWCTMVGSQTVWPWCQAPAVQHWQLEHPHPHPHQHQQGLQVRGFHQPGLQGLPQCWEAQRKKLSGSCVC